MDILPKLVKLMRCSKVKFGFKNQENRVHFVHGFFLSRKQGDFTWINTLFTISKIDGIYIDKNTKV